MQAVIAKRYISDFGVLFPHVLSYYENALMTAISLGLTRDGFIIATDGRTRLDDATRNAAPKELLDKETENAQKIFPIERTNAHLAFAMAGSLVSDDSRVDLRYIVQIIASHLSHQPFETFQAYMEVFANNLTNAIQMKDHLPQSPENKRGDLWIICDLFICGYFHNKPVLYCININHNGTDVIHNPALCPYPLLYGSYVIASDMYDLSPTVGNMLSTAQFTPKANSHFPNNQVLISNNPDLDEMQRFCVGYIIACSSELAITLDKPICRNIGGHVHVAEISPSGFRWRIPPKSISL